MAATIKTGSKAYRDRLRAQLIALGFPTGRLTEQVALDLIARCGKRPREAWRLANELSLDEVAVRCNAISTDPRAPLRKNRIWEYEQWPHGGCRPTVRTLRLLAKVFQTGWERLVDLEDLAQMPNDDRDAYHTVIAALRRERATERTAVAPLQTYEADRLGRRDPTPTEGSIEEAAEESADLATWACASNIDADGLAQLNREIRAIAHAYVFSLPYPLFLRTRKLRNRAVRLLRGHQPWRHTRDLYLISAHACTLMAWMFGDLGNYAAAGDHGWAAWMCAQHADHNGARAWIRATQSKLAFWDGDYIESARLASDGLTYSTGETAPLLLVLLEARAWARLGRVDDAEAALDRWRRMQAGSYRDEIGGLLGLTPAQQHYLAGSTYLWLREPAKALAETEEALALFEATPTEQRFYGAEMLARVDACRASLQSGDLDAAERHVEPVLVVEPDQRLETFLQSLGHVRTGLAARQHRGNHKAQALQERIEDYATEAVGRTVDLRR